MANKDFQDYVDLTVEIVKDAHAALADGKFDAIDSLAFIPALSKVPAAVAGSSVAFKDLSAEDVKAAAVAVLEAAGGFEGKAKVYVEEGFAILGHGVGIYESAKKILDAGKAA